MGNDIWESTFPQRDINLGSGHLKPTFTLKNNKLIEPENGIGHNFCKLYLKCIFLKILYGSIDQYWQTKLPVPVAAFSNPNLNIPVYETPEDIQDEKSDWSIWLVNDSPRKLYGIQLVNALHKEIQSLSNSHGSIFFAFDFDWFTAINQVKLTNGRLNAIKAGYFLPGFKYLKYNNKFFLAGDKEEYMKVSAEVDSDVPFFVATMNLKKDPFVNYEDVHLNNEGNVYVLDQVAEKIVGALQPKN